MKFRFNESLTVDTSQEPYKTEGIHIGIFSQTGGGKSQTGAAWIIESFLEQAGTSVVVLQPDPEWHSLAAKYPQVVVVGGPHNADIPFIPVDPELYAKMVVKQGASFVIDTSDVPFREEEQLVEWVAEFLDHIFKLEATVKRPLLIVLDEASNYAPREAKGHVADAKKVQMMMQAVRQVATRGRKLNIQLLVMTQRPQMFDYTTRQELNIVLFGRFSSQDIGYLDKEIFPFYEDALMDMMKDEAANALQERKIDAETIAKTLESISYKNLKRLLKDLKAEGVKNLHPMPEALLDFKPGEFLIIDHGDAMVAYCTVKRKTPHGGETPDLDYVAPHSEQMKKAISSFAADVREAFAQMKKEQDDVAKLTKELAAAKKQVTEMNDKMKVGLNLKEILSDLSGNGKKADVGEVVTELEGRILGHERTIKTLEDKIADKQKRIETLEKNSGTIEPLMAVIYENAVKAADIRLDERIPQLRQEMISTMGRHMASVEGGLVIQHTPTEATIRQTDPLRIDFDTTTATGRVIYALVMVLKKPSSESMISEVMAEYAWPNSHGSVSKAISTLVGENMLVKQGSDPVLYRPASMVKFVPDKEVEKAK